MLRKRVYPYKYTDSWKRFDETFLHDKGAFYSSLIMEDITDVDYGHAERVFEYFNSKNVGDYHDFYIQIDTLLLADVFDAFTCLKIYELDSAHFYHYLD